MMGNGKLSREEIAHAYEKIREFAAECSRILWEHLGDKSDDRK